MTNKKQPSKLLNARLNVALSITDALSNSESIMSVEGLSNKIDVSTSYIEQVIALLRKGKIVSSTRGPGGGYALTNSCTTVRDVINAVNPDAFKSNFNQQFYTALESAMVDMTFIQIKRSEVQPCL